MPKLIDSILNSSDNITLLRQKIPQKIKSILELPISELILNPDGSAIIEENNKLKLLSDKITRNELEQLVDFVTYFNNKALGFTNPIFDGVLPNGLRINIISQPVAENNYIITIRKKNINNVKLEDLIKLKTITEKGIAELMLAIKNKKNILISGGTSAGKTTLLNAIINILPKDEKLIILEDTSEIDYQSPFCTKLLTVNHKETNTYIDLGDLVKATLRMRPDRIIVGEIRGNEAYHLLHAMNTGHNGVLSTIHANSSRDALRRLEILSILGQKNLDIQVPRAWISNNIDIVIHMQKTEKGRKIKEITKIEGIEGNTYILDNILN